MVTLEALGVMLEILEAIPVVLCQMLWNQQVNKLLDQNLMFLH